MGNSNEAMRAARAFEVYVRYIWPIHRKLVFNKIAKRCVHCAASEKMVHLASNGICDLCAQRSSGPTSQSWQVSARHPQDLEQILADCQGRGSQQYDALLLFSGGKDSTWLVRRISENYPGLRLLAMTVDNGFMSSVAKENIDYLLPKLNVDHIFVRPRKSFYIRLFKYCITHLNQEGGYGTLDFSDGEFMLDSARKIAAEKRIPLILCGYSKYQVQNGLKLNGFESPREHELKDRTQTAGIPLTDIFSPSEVREWWHGSAYPPDSVARLLFPMAAWNLEESEIKAKVVEWGLIKDKNQSPIVTNHQLIPLIGVVDVHKLGYSSFESEFCRMIREGKALKSDWQGVFEFLEYTAMTGMFVKPPVLEGLVQLGLSLDEVGIKFNNRKRK